MPGDVLRSGFDGLSYFVLKNKVASIKAEYERAKSELDSLEKSCHHQWSETETGYQEYTTYEENMNAPVHRGSDMWYETMAVHRSKPVWTRTCKVCGKQETTDKTDVVTKLVPKF
jgi:hypothetical protein